MSKSLACHLKTLGVSVVRHHWYIGNHFSGCFIYADDITLVAPSVDALNDMLKVCELYAGEHDITFNSNKTKLMHFTINPLTTRLLKIIQNWIITSVVSCIHTMAN